MGEYATANDGADVKIGTCENMYYLRADQIEQVSGVGYDLRKVSEDGAARFRFPWPDEDALPAGVGRSGRAEFDNHDRCLRIDGLAVPEDVEHYSVQFSAANGYLVSLPCPESLGTGELRAFQVDTDGSAVNEHVLRIGRNGYGGAAHLIQQRFCDGLLVAVAKCGGCGCRWRMPTLEDAQPLLDALEAMAAAQERQGELDARAHGEEYRASPLATAATYREIARRVTAGYMVEALA